LPALIAVCTIVDCAITTKHGLCNNAKKAVILFRDVEHCGISFVTFTKFRPGEISSIPRNSSQFRNSV
jgi:hypothetical protein